MTQAELTTWVRILVDDTLTRRWTAAQVYTALNMAARFVLRQISRHQRHLNYGNDSVDITTDGTNKQYTLGDAAFVREFYVSRTDTTDPEPTYRIDERDEPMWANTDGFDDSNRIVYFIRIGEDGTQYLKFPVVHPAGYVLHVEYNQGNTDLATDGSAVASSYTQIPVEFHELIAARTAFVLLGADLNQSNPAAALYAELMQDMHGTLAKTGRPKTIKNDMQWSYV